MFFIPLHINLINIYLYPLYHKKEAFTIHSFIRNIFYAKKSRNFPCFFSIFGKIPYSLFFNLLYNRG
ncbi:hypothetical protein CLOSCI_03504 [[Clostridium] scindens ATCC 35704]|nr:hypothetical protein CLOSCI_03504 [[Clostridium] scindens ATCC 35704]